MPAGFTVLAVASLGLLLIGAGTPLWLIAVLLSVRSASIGLITNPLLQALLQPLPPKSSATPARCSIPGSGSPDRSTSGWSPPYTRRKPGRTAVAALHTAGLVLAAIALAGVLGAVALPAVRNTALLGRG